MIAIFQSLPPLPELSARLLQVLKENVALATWIGTILTITAITIALFRESFLVWWRRPKLVIADELRADKFPYETPSGNVAYSGYNFRLAVGNRGKTKAENVE